MTTITLSIRQATTISDLGRALFQKLKAAGEIDLAIQVVAMEDDRLRDPDEYIKAVQRAHPDLQIEWQEAR